MVLKASCVEKVRDYIVNITPKFTAQHDPGMLANYVETLLARQETRAELKETCRIELGELLENDTDGFVEDLFSFLSRTNSLLDSSEAEGENDESSPITKSGEILEEDEEEDVEDEEAMYRRGDDEDEDSKGDSNTDKKGQLTKPVAPLNIPPGQLNAALSNRSLIGRRLQPRFPQKRMAAHPPKYGPRGIPGPAMQMGMQMGRRPMNIPPGSHRGIGVAPTHLGLIRIPPILPRGRGRGIGPRNMLAPPIGVGSLTKPTMDFNYRKYKKGMIFLCKKDTYQECLRLRLLGAPKAYQRDIEAVIPRSTALFLLNTDTRLLHGIYEAASKGGANLVPHAWSNGPRSGSKPTTPLPAQVRFSIAFDCKPQIEDLFVQPLHGRKRVQLLNEDQTHSIIKIFLNHQNFPPQSKAAFAQNLGRPSFNKMWSPPNLHGVPPFRGGIRTKRHARPNRSAESLKVQMEPFQGQTRMQSATRQNLANVGAVPSRMRRRHSSKPAEGIPQRVLEIRNVPDSLNTITSLSKYFGRYGKVVSVNIHKKDKRASVQYENEEQAQKAFDAPYPVCGSRLISLFYKGKKATASMKRASAPRNVEGSIHKKKLRPTKPSSISPNDKGVHPIAKGTQKLEEKNPRNGSVVKSDTSKLKSRISSGTSNAEVTKRKVLKEARELLQKQQKLLKLLIEQLSKADGNSKGKIRQKIRNLNDDMQKTLEKTKKLPN